MCIRDSIYYGQGTAVPNASFNVKEVYGELKLPLVTDKPFFQSLNIEGGARYSYYTNNTTTGTNHFKETTYKFGGDWTPVNGLRFRAVFNRAVREAVKRINADKAKYLHYFIDYHAKTDPEIAALKVEDLRESRLVVCDPAPIPLEEMQRTYDWLKSWGMLEETASPLDLVNMDVQRYAHQAAE